MKTKLVIFDWAGTTVDYGCFAPLDAFEKAFAAFDIYPTAEEIRKPMGMLKRDHIRTMLLMETISKAWEAKTGRTPLDSDVDKIYAVFEKSLMDSLSEYSVLKPGVLACVEKLKRKNILIGSTTGYTGKMMEVVTKRAALQGYHPDFWCCPEDVGGYGRPYPYMIFENMKHFGISSVEEVIKVGDTVSDIQEGKNAGVKSFGVIEGSSVLGLTQAVYEALPNDEKEVRCREAEEKFISAGADQIIKNFNTFPDLLK